MADKARKVDPMLELHNRANTLSRNFRKAWVDLEKKRPEFTKRIFKRFDDVDLDQDGLMSSEEIDDACADPQFVGDDAAALATLQTRMVLLAEEKNDDPAAEDDGVTRADLTGLEKRALLLPSHDSVTNVNARYDFARKKILDSPRTVFARPSVPSLDPIRLKQGMVGDCFFLAPLVAMASHDAPRVLAMIRPGDANESTWRIAFPGGERLMGGKSAVTVSNPTDTEIALFGTADALWPVVFEKAFGQLRFGSIYGTLKVKRSALDALDFGPMGEAMAVLTGNDIENHTLPKTPIEGVRARIEEALGDDKIVCASTPGKSDTDKTPAGLAAAHAYAVIGYDRSSDKIVLRNPWGTKNGGPNQAQVFQGLFEMSLALFCQEFRKINYET